MRTPRLAPVVVQDAFQPCVSGQLRWRDAERRDRRALQQFLCTPPTGRRKYGRAAPPRDRKWELDVQGYIRQLRPPAHGGEVLVVGEDAGGIGAVAHAENDPDPSRMFVAAIAVALRLRGYGHERKVGDELIEELINRLANRADSDGYPGLTLWGKVDSRNTACERLCFRVGGENFDRDGPYERWIARVEFLDS